jgi:hypothetical protein
MYWKGCRRTGLQTTSGFMLACSVAWLTLAAVCSSEMLVNLYQSARHHNLEDGIFHSHCCENLISHIYPCSKPKVVLYIKWLHYFTFLRSVLTKMFHHNLIQRHANFFHSSVNVSPKSKCCRI